MACARLVVLDEEADLRMLEVVDGVGDGYSEGLVAALEGVRLLQGNEEVEELILVD